MTDWKKERFKSARERADNLIERVTESFSRNEDGIPLSGPHFGNRSVRRGSSGIEAEPVNKIGHAKRKKIRKRARLTRRNNR